MTMEHYAALFETPIGADVRRHLSDTRAIFVFPSQDSADSWAQALVKSGLCRAVALDRFFGFENFLRHCTALREHKGFRTVQPIDKWAWALEVLNARSEGPKQALSLKRLLPSAEASTLQLSRLVELIPGLYEIETLRKGRPEPLPYDFLQEEFEALTLLAQHYRSYLDKNHLLDGHLAPLVLPPQIEVHAYGLEADFRRFGLAEGALEGADGSRLIFPNVISFGSEHTAQRARSALPYYEFDSFLAELEAVLIEISTAISQGYEPEEIVISVCRLNAQKAAWIRQTAKVFGIPISVRWGEPLSLSGFGRLLRAIQRAASDGLTLDSLDAFCAFESIKSRNAEGWNALRRAALRAHIPSPSPDADYVHRLWKESAQIGICTPECAEMYERLWRDITDIAQAKSFLSLYRHILGFLEHWVDTSRLGADPRTDRPMRMALDELQSWMDREATLHLGPFRPFEVYMRVLDTKSYIPLLEENAVHVYDFKATSGLATMVQYVIGASQSGLAFSLGDQSALPSELSALFGPKVESEFEGMLAMHGIGRTTYSFARQSLEGYEVAHPLLGPASKKVTKKIRPPCATKTSSEDTARTHSYAHPPPIDLEVSARFLQSTQSFDVEKKLAVFSPHSLRDRMRCAFRWFAQRIDLEDAYSNDDTARIVGDFLHATYQRTIRSLPQDLSDAEAPDEFRKAFERAVRTTQEKILAEHGPGLRPTLQALIDRAHHRLGELWHFERTTFQAYTRVGFEIPASYTFEREGTLFNGRIDCVFSRIDTSLGAAPRYVIVDYKKNRIPLLSELKIRSQDTDRDDVESTDSTDFENGSGMLSVKEIQLPSYALMLEKSGGIVEGALYWSIEKTEAVAYLRPPAVSIRAAYGRREDTVSVQVSLLEMLAYAAAAVWRGILLDPASDREACSDCTFKPLCRYWYFLEL